MCGTMNWNVILGTEESTKYSPCSILATSMSRGIVFSNTIQELVGVSAEFGVWFNEK